MRVILTDSLCLMPKCLASQVTSSPKPINPEVTPATALSWVDAVDA